jgi:hypothetical protein
MRVYSTYTEATEKSLMGGGVIELKASPFLPSIVFLSSRRTGPNVNWLKAVVASKGYHYKFSCVFNS